MVYWNFFRFSVGAGMWYKYLCIRYSISVKNSAPTRKNTNALVTLIPSLEMEYHSVNAPALQNSDNGIAMCVLVSASRKGFSKILPGPGLGVAMVMPKRGRI